MPINTVADNDVLTASFWNANVRDQVVSTTTSGARPSGTEGQVIYETDTDAFQVYNGGWIEYGRTAGATTWTPQIDQGATTNIAKTVVTAFYIRRGNIVDAWCTLAVTASGTAGSNLTVTLPVAPVGYTANDPLGSAYVNDSSAAANSTASQAWYVSGSTLLFRAIGGTNWGVSPNVAIASGDSIRFQVSYRVA